MHRLHACPSTRRSATAWHEHSGVVMWPWSFVHFTGAFCMEFPRRFSRIWGDCQWSLKQLMFHAKRSWTSLNVSWKINKKNPVLKTIWLMEVSLFLHLQWFHFTSLSQDYSSTDKQEQSACACWRQHPERTKMTLGPSKEVTLYWQQMLCYARRTTFWPPRLLFHLQVI